MCNYIWFFSYNLTGKVLHNNDLMKTCLSSLITCMPGLVSNAADESIGYLLEVWMISFLMLVYEIWWLFYNFIKIKEYIQLQAFTDAFGDFKSSILGRSWRTAASCRCLCWILNLNYLLTSVCALPHDPVKFTLIRWKNDNTFFF
jgi:hypothetical protein